MVARTALSAPASAYYGVATTAAASSSPTTTTTARVAPAQQLELLRARLRASGAPYEARYADPTYVDALLRALRSRAADVARVRARVVAIRAENDKRAAALAVSGKITSPALAAVKPSAITTTPADADAVIIPAKRQEVVGVCSTPKAEIGDYDKSNFNSGFQSNTDKSDTAGAWGAHPMHVDAAATTSSFSALDTTIRVQEDKTRCTTSAPQTLLPSCCAAAFTASPQQTKQPSPDVQGATEKPVSHD